MHSTRIEVGAYEAKTKLPALLRGIREGLEYVITNRGVAVAHLIPAQEMHSQGAADAVRKMKAFMKKKRVKGINIKALIEEGRA